jgi:serine/threonine protein phosphatase PrpC
MRCLIIATDGVTNLISPTEAALIVEDYVGRKYARMHSGKLPARQIVDRALAIARNPRRSRGPVDNASAIVIILTVDDEDDDAEPIVDKNEGRRQITIGDYINSIESPEKRPEKRGRETLEGDKEDRSTPAKAPKKEASEELEIEGAPRRHSQQPAETERNMEPRTRSRTF